MWTKTGNHATIGNNKGTNERCETMIPKIIHYCWFGGGSLPETAKECMRTWSELLPDYAVRRWDESSFDIHSCPYVEEAYQAGKYAFVTDYVRLYALYHEGGVYMDTDVEVVRPLDEFLQLQGFSGFEKPDEVPTGIMAAERGLPFIAELLHDYDDLHFLKADGSQDVTTNVVRITNAALRHGLKLNNERQTVDGFTFFPMDVFCPKDPRTREINRTERTYTIHHFAGSWLPRDRQRDHALKEKLVTGSMNPIQRFAAQTERKWIHLKERLNEKGFLGAVRYYLHKGKR